MTLTTSMLRRSASTLRQQATGSCVRMTRSGEIRSSGGSFAKKEQAQEDMWAHKRDMEKLKELQEKLKKAHDELEKHTSEMITKTSTNTKK